MYVAELQMRRSGKNAGLMLRVVSKINKGTRKWLEHLDRNTRRICDVKENPRVRGRYGIDRTARLSEENI